ncbi:hypothetical protein GGER_32980 [Serratia rubidaea]
MINKSVPSTDDAVADIADGASVMVGGFGPAGQPYALLDALIRRRPRNLTVISNNAGNGDFGLAALLKAGCVRKIVCSFPRQSDSWVFDELYRRGELELELLPQGNLAARIQAGAPASAASIPRPATAPSWRRTKRCAKSTVGTTCSSCR